MPEVISNVREQLQRRLKELEPMLQEHSRITRALDLLADRVRPNSARRSTGRRATTRRSRSSTETASKTTSKSASRGRATSAPRTSTKSRATTPRARRSGGRRDQLLAVIQAQPGVTIAEAAQEMKIKPNYLYRIAADLQKSGAIKKDGSGYKSSS